MRKILTLVFSLFALCTYHQADACHSGGIRPSAVTYTIGGTATAPTLTVTYPLASPRTNCGTCGYCMVYRLYEEQSCGTSTFVGGATTSGGTWNPTCGSTPAAPEVVNIVTTPLAVCPGKTYYITWTAQDACTGGVALDPVDLNNPLLTTGPLGYAASGTLVVTIPGEMPWGLNLTLNEPDALSNCNAPSPGTMAYDETLADGPTTVVKPSMELICGQVFDINWAMDNFCSNYVWNTGQVSILKDGALVAGPSARNEADNGNYVDACVSAAHTYSVCIQEGACHNEDNFQGNGASNTPQCFDFPVTVINSTNTSLAFDQAIYCYGAPVTLTGAGTVYGNIDAVHDIVVNGTKYANGVIIDGTTGSCNIGTTSPNTLSGINDGTYGYGAQTYTSSIRYTPACATCPPSPIPANAIFLEQLNAAFVSESCNATGGIDVAFTLTGGSPQYNATDAYTVSNLSLGTLSPAVISAGSPKTITISIPASTPLGTAITFDVSDTYGCSRSFSYNTVTEAPPAPTPVGNNNICQGASSVPVAQQLTATCAACAVPACTDVCAPCATGAPTSTTVSLGSNSEDYFGYCETCGACSTSSGGDACGDDPSTTPDFGCGGGSVNTFNVTVSTPPSTIPSCATLSYTITGGFTSINGSFAGELFVRVTPPGGSPTVYNPGTGVCSGTNQTFTIASGSGAPTAGSWLIEMSDVYNDGGAAADGNLVVNVNVVYIVPTLPPPPPPVPADITWYDAPTGGTVQGTGSPFDPTGKISAQGPVDLNLPGNYTFYANCGCGDCESTRTPVIFTVVPKAAGPSVDDEELCIGGTVPTITPIGSAIGSLFNIYALGTTTPLNAAPQGQFTSANLVSYGFNPNMVGETTYLVTEITDPTGLACESNPTAFSITVNPAPTPTASNSGPYCEGETIEVSATGGFFYNWSGPGAYSASGSPGFRFNADPTMAGTYTVTVTNLQSCSATASTNVVVNPNPAAPAGIAADMCIGTTVPALSADVSAVTCPSSSGLVPGALLTDQVIGSGSGSVEVGSPYTQTISYTLPSNSVVTNVRAVVSVNNIQNYNDITVLIDGSPVYTGTGALGFPNAGSGTYPGIAPTPSLGAPCTLSCTGVVSVNPGSGSLSISVSDNLGFDDSSPEAMVSVSIIADVLPYNPCLDCSPSILPNVTWWNSPVGGTQQGSGITFTPTSGTSTALLGIFDATVPGTYTFFAQTECGACESTRTPVSLTVNPNPTPVASNSGPICSGTTATVSATGGTSYLWNTGATTASFTTLSLTINTTYTATVTDGNGCTATASTTVVVNPNPTATIAAPTYTVCEDGTVVIDGGASGGTTLYTYVWGGAGAPFLVNATLSDPLFDASLTVPGSYPLTLQIVDANGCSSTVASTTVIVSAGSAPAISCPANVILSTDNGLCTTQYQPTAPTTNNGCYGDLILTYALTGVTTGSGTGTVPSTDFNIGATTVTYTVTDANASTATATCSFTITVEDKQPPLISCPASITQSSGAGACTASVTVPLPLTVTDNCTASPTVTYTRTGATTGSGSGAATGTYNVGVTIVTYTATDAAGNTAACQLTVTVVENILPTITCPSNLTRTVVADATTNCTYTATTAEVSPTIGDNCTAVTVAANVSYIAFGATTAVGTGAATINYNVGTTFVTYTVTDASGNTRQCTFSVVVTDNTAPTITCPANVNGTTDLNTCNSLETIALPTNVADNCAVASYTNSYNNTPNSSGVYPLGTTNITYTVTDIYSNTATCAFSVTITDTQAPSIICPTSLTAYTGAGATTCSAVVTTLNTALSFDNCTAIPVIGYVLSGATTGSGTSGNANGTYNVGTTTVTFTATDNASNTATCAITVVVIDNTPPAITCAANITVANSTGNCYATPNVPRPTALDNCTAATALVHNYVLSGATTGSGSNIGAGGITGVNFNVGLTTVTWTVIDVVGNSSTCSHTVRVNDTQAPVLTCPIAVSVNAASCSAFANVGTLGVADNCGTGYSASFVITNTNNLGNNNTIVRSGIGVDASGIFPVGVSTVTYTVADGAGNTASCSSTVTINDVVAPTIVCPSSGDITVYSNNNGTGDCDATVAIDPILAYDNCNSVVFTYTIQHFSTSNPATVVATVTGGNVGNFASGGSTWTSDPDASGDFSVGLNIVTYTATDRYGNTATCAIRVSVLDNETPTITCPANVLLPNATGTCGSPVTIPVPVTADNCGVRSVINNYNNTNNASGIYPIGLTTVIWTVTDINGNTTTCGMFVRIDDNEAPNVICQNITIGVNSTSPTAITPSQVFNTNSMDNCGSVVPVSVSPNSFICPQNEGANTVTLIVSDTHGNTASCQATVTVVCCVAEAGNVQLAQAPCPNQAIFLSASGYMIDPGYAHWYIVTNTSGQIVWTQQAGATATIPVNALPIGQNYCLYGYSVKTSTATSAPTGNISSISTWASCNDLSSPCRQFYVPNNPPALLGSSNISQGIQGGISPFYYDTNTITVWGGTAPYQFAWDNTGYVRYDVFYGNVDHDNNPATPAIPGATITVFYADAASWSVIVTDSNACSTVNLPFGNIPGQTNTLLDIDRHTINPQTSTVSPNGSITLCVTGGPVGCVPTYLWSLPNGQTLTTANAISGTSLCPSTSNSTNLSNLSYGWYSVTVTCGGESTQGWYWVPRQRRGRNKDDMQQAINVTPNPFATVTEIEFSVEQSGMTRVAVYSVDGKEVALLFNEQADADEAYTLSFDGSNLASGVYVVKVESEGGTVETAKLMLTK